MVLVPWVMTTPAMSGSFSRPSTIMPRFLRFSGVSQGRNSSDSTLTRANCCTSGMRSISSLAVRRGSPVVA